MVFRATSEDTSATCADANGDGVSGLTSVQVGLQDETSGQRLLALFQPEAGEIEEEGWHAVTIRIGDATLNGIVHVILPRGAFESRD